MTKLLFIALLFVQAPTTKPASIDGSVYQAEDSKPIAEAAVELSSVARNGATRFTAATTAEGKFSLSGIPPGEYRLAATHAGHVRGEYGQRGPNSRGLTLVLSEGQNRKDTKIMLVATGSIAGRIHDANGAPMANVQVQAFRYVYQNGQRSLTPARVAITNDLGEYRMYWLPPQQYVVMALPLRGAVGDEFISAAGADFTINNLLKPPTGKPIQVGDADESTPFYFPGAIDQSGASPIDVKPGADVGGIDMTLRAPLSFRIRGMVTDFATAGAGQGAPPQIRLTSKTAPFSSTFAATLAGSVERATGKFEIKGVPPGSYMLVMQGAGGFGLLPIDVSTDLDDVTVSMTPAVDVPIRVRVDGDISDNPRPELGQVRVQAIPIGSTRGQAANPVPQQPPGTFLLRGAPAVKLRLAFANLPSTAYVKSARYGQTDVLLDGLTPDRRTTSPLEIGIGLKGGELTGTVVDARLQPLSNVTVVIVPNTPGRERIDLYKQAATNDSGQFHISGIAPGDYKVFAWEDVPPSAWQHPDFIRRYENRGTPLHVEEGSTESRQVLAIPD